MENKNIGEELDLMDESQCVDVENENGEKNPEVSCSPLGKFKDSESLFNAYNNLQAEFTRKCQKLSELEREKIKSEEQPAITEPIYAQSDWNSKVLDFLEKNQEAKPYAKDISNEILNNNGLYKDENALNLAWAKIMQKEFKSPKQLTENEDVLGEFINKNEKLKNKIIEDYIKSLEEKKAPPVISNSGQTSVAFKSSKQPTSMEEAKAMVELLFKSKP